VLDVYSERTRRGKIHRLFEGGLHPPSEDTIMPHIFDNIEQSLLPALARTMQACQRADFCVGYFNLRGWKQVDQYVERWSGEDDRRCRLLVGMQTTPQEELRQALALSVSGDGIDNPQAIRLKRKLAEEFRNQLMLGAPTNQDEAGLRRLAQQLRAGKLVVKLHLSYPLHAKLYLLFRDDFNNPIIGYLGSSNLTMAGLSGQGELNIDVLDCDACDKLAVWFEERWNDLFCLDISKELIAVIEESWAREDAPTPYEIYLKMAYHLAQEARAGLSEFSLPPEFRNKLFAYQAAAVKIAARHLNRRGGVLIGDVVGLGKTLMGTALARIFEEDYGLSTLIICPKSLTKMWQQYVDQYGLRAKVMSSSVVLDQLQDVPARFRLVLIDESHNLRNREGKRYRAIKQYIDQSDARCILLTATPYNKTYLDLSAQLRLFVDEDRDIGVRPEHMLRDVGEAEFAGRYQVLPSTLAAFEKSAEADDWRELMRLFLVRRTRTFIQAHYAQTDADGRKYLVLEDGSPSYFPTRVPKTLKFAIDSDDPEDQYARLYSEIVVDTVNSLALPRYGLANYLRTNADQLADAAERRVIENLSRAGKRLLGYCRTGLFKRLESSGSAFVQSVDRHVLRNYIFLYAIENNLPLPIGTQDAEMLDPGVEDEDPDSLDVTFDPEEQADMVDRESLGLSGNGMAQESATFSAATYEARARDAYAMYRANYASRFKWVKPGLFRPDLKVDLAEDASRLITVLQRSGAWDAAHDRKLARLHELLTTVYPHQKVLVFTQFSDTVHYLTGELKLRGLASLEGATGHSQDPTGLAWRFSPVSNEQRERVPPDKELRVLVATDVLSEGQNLQDAAIVVNYDLPWAIIRLIQRTGRVDRIGQKAPEIFSYSFLPADGVEQIIHLRSRVRQRLRENSEVLGSDEQFFEDEKNAQDLRDLYTEKSGILDDEPDSEVDLVSQAQAVWEEATRDNPALARRIAALPDVVYSTRDHQPTAAEPDGVLVYVRTADDADALAWAAPDGRLVTTSQLAILRAARCAPDTPAIARRPQHHALVKGAVEQIAQEERLSGGQLGQKSGARYKAYMRLKAYYDFLKTQSPLLASDALQRVVDDLYRYPLRESAKDSINRQIKGGASDADLAQLCTSLREGDRLSLILDEGDQPQGEPRIICSMGLFPDSDRLGLKPAG
jgi:superfamily II DNA or RNA helicase